MTFRQQISTSFFLCEQPFVQEFAKKVVLATHEDGFASNKTFASNTTFSVVCERKEDLVALRSQLFYALNAERALAGLPATDVVAGVSMYTLDSLGEYFSATFANSSAAILGEDRVHAFRQPYLDVPTQEKLMKMLLMHFGYRGADAQPLAKQLLSLLDVAWPPDYSFFHLLQETQSLELDRTIKEITEKSLREMLAVYQAGQHVLGSFSRFQSIVAHFLEQDFLDLLRKKIDNAPGFENFVLPQRFLRSNILWMAAPEYATYSSLSQSEAEMLTSQAHSLAFYRPGDLQAHMVDTFRNTVVEAQRLLTKDESIFWHARTCVVTNMHPQIKLPTAHVSYLFANNKHQVAHDLKNLLSASPDLSLEFGSETSALDGTFVMLADFDPGHFREIYSDASGKYAVSDQNLNHFFKNRQRPSPEEIPAAPSPQDVVHAHLNDAFELFLELNEVLQDEKEFLQNLSKQYQLGQESTIEFQHFAQQSPQIQLESFFMRWCADETVSIGETHPLARVDKALSFVAVQTIPRQIVAVGPAHAPTLPSFNVKILNDAFYLLRKKGVPLGLPASDTTYRGFWSWLAQKEIPLSFWLLESTDLDTFPAYLAPQNESRVASLHPPLPSVFKTSLDQLLSPDRQYLLPNWIQRFQWKTSSRGLPKVSVTGFENYIDCPLRFLLGDILAIEDYSSDFSRGNALDAGNRTHRVAELFLQGLRQVFANAQLHEAEPLLARLVAKLQNESFFLSASSEDWFCAFRQAAQDALPLHSATAQLLLANTFQEICTHIFSSAEQALDPSPPSEPSPTSPPSDLLKDGITREIVKRTFRRLVEVEHERLTNPNSKAALRLAFVEHPVEFVLGGISFSGRIDRIDTSPQGFQILDYKTSKIPKTERQLVLCPSEKKPQNQLSVQAALYSYAWALHNTLSAENDTPVQSFSLYRLKNLDPQANSFLTYEFQPPLQSTTELFKSIADEYTLHATRLAAGDFSPRPVHQDSCKTCSFVALCPVGRKNTGIGTGEDSDSSSEGDTP